MSRSDEPELPDDGLVQLRLPDVGVVHRLCDDGRYLVGHSGLDPVMSEPLGELEIGRSTLSDRALARIRSTLIEMGFFELDAEVEGQPMPEGLIYPGAGTIEPLRLVYTARLDRMLNQVTVTGHPDIAWSVGPLEPLQDVLNDEVFGLDRRE